MYPTYNVIVPTTQYPQVSYISCILIFTGQYSFPTVSFAIITPLQILYRHKILISSVNKVGILQSQQTIDFYLWFVTPLRCGAVSAVTV